jgi:branched-subunit amino acid permease
MYENGRIMCSSEVLKYVISNFSYFIAVLHCLILSYGTIHRGLQAILKKMLPPSSEM